MFIVNILLDFTKKIETSFSKIFHISKQYQLLSNVKKNVIRRRIV